MVASLGSSSYVSLTCFRYLALDCSEQNMLSTPQNVNDTEGTYTVGTGYF